VAESHERSPMKQLGKNMWSAISTVPTRFTSVIDQMNTRLVSKGVPGKVRPPRFFSYTMELEPFSTKKALSLEILHEINNSSGTYSSESIQKLVNLGRYVLIFTERRLICVEETLEEEKKSRGSRGKETIENFAVEQPIADAGEDDEAWKQTPYEQYNELEDDDNSLLKGDHKHWNVLFEDVMAIKIDQVVVENLADEPEPVLRKFTYDDANVHMPRHNLRLWYSDDSKDNADFRLGYKDIHVLERYVRQLHRVLKYVQERTDCDF
jgi:hypothetical protein